MHLPENRGQGAFSHANPGPDALANVVDLIISHCEQAPSLQFRVREALDSARRAKTGADVRPNGARG